MESQLQDLEDSLRSGLHLQEGTERENTSEAPCKQQKKYQAFGPEEKAQLKKYKTWESQTMDILDRTRKKLQEDFSQRDILNYLMERLENLEKMASLDPIYIGVFGKTGAGKTSLINAIIGKRFLLPVSGQSVCTSCVVQVKVRRADQYEATIHLLTDAEWKEELKNLVEILKKNEYDEDDDDLHECVKDATEKLHALYGKGSEVKDYETLLKMETNLPVSKNRIITIKAKEANEFSKLLDTYIRVPEEDTDGLWPLIKYVEVTIPGSEFLPEGIIIVDTRGTGDFNNKRDEMWKQSINTCSVIWIISEMKRVHGEDIPTELLDESIKAFTRGVCTDITMVVTLSDIMALNEYKRNRKPSNNNKIENEHNAILERNRDVKKRKEKLIKEKLQRKLPPDSEVLNKPKLVYTVSLQEFWDQKHLNQAETEVPELREYLRIIYLKKKQKLVKDYVTEVWNIHRLAQNLGSKPQLEDLVFQKSDVEELMLKDIDTLEMQLEKCFHEIQQPLNEGVKHARKNYKDTVNMLLTGAEGYRGYHKTLKAVCLKDGVHASKRFARIDFQESLAKPIYTKVDGSFGRIFRTQNVTRSSLWYHLDQFKNELQSKIHQTGGGNGLSNNTSKIEMFILEANVILKKTEKLILEKKLSIYQSLCESIQCDLKPYYNDASKVKGQGSYEQMKTILAEGIEKEVTNNMFEKATSKMESRFQKLKRDLVVQLKEDISIVFNLVFLQQEWDPVHLADIENECREIDEIYNKLQNDNE